MVPLVKHFFGGFFDNDWLSRNQDMGAALAQIFGLIAAPGLLIPMILYPFYELAAGMPSFQREMALLQHKCFFICFSMLVTGFVSIIEWDALFPNARDYRILTPLPVPARTVFAAKFTALFLFLLSFGVVVNAFSPVMFPVTSLSAAEKSPSLTDIFCLGMAHAAALYAATAFTFFFFVAVQGILMNLLSYRWFKRVGQGVQLVSLVALLCGFFVHPQATLLLQPHSTGTPLIAYFFPPLWFLGLYEKLLRYPSPLFDSLAGIALRALGLAIATSLAAYVLTYRRYIRRSIESAITRAAGPGLAERAWNALVERLTSGDPLEMAAYHFIAKTLARSRRHRLVLATYAGVSLALVLDSLGLLLAGPSHEVVSNPGPALLSVQLVLAFFLIAGMRYAFTIPVELQANWVFRLADNADGRRYLSCGRKALIVFGAMPPLLLLLLPQWVLWGWKTAALHFLYGFVLALVLVDLLLLNFHKIPFTCSYLPGKANIKARWLWYWLGFSIYAYGMARIEYSLLRAPVRLLVFCAAVLVLRALWCTWQALSHRPCFGFVFQDEPEPVVLTLNLDQ